ncbi:MAG: hypothetical protein ABSH07_02370 [Candidatus Dormibacteria bacterium]
MEEVESVTGVPLDAGEAGVRSCVFCGSVGSLTREHVFPAWLRSLARFPQGRYRTGVIGSTDELHDWVGLAFNHTARRICRECNSGWLSRMEVAVSDLFHQLQEGHHVLLDERRQRLIAVWLYKTALTVTLTQSHEASRIPGAHFRLLRETGSPPVGTRLWLGRLESDDVEAGLWVQRFDWWDRQEGQRLGREGYALAIAVLSVVGFAIVMEGIGEAEDALRLGSVGYDHLQRVWPPSPNYVIVSPPPKALSFATLAQMMDALRRMGGSLDDGGIVPGSGAQIP